MGRRGIGCKELLNELKAKRTYWELKTEALITLRGEFALDEATDLSQGTAHDK